jgi:hypothetical protein
MAEGLEDLYEMGPVDYLVIEFPKGHVVGQNLPMLVDLVDRGIIRILDLSFVKREDDGAVTMMSLADVDRDGTFDLAVFQGVSSGLVGQDDANDAGQVLEPGSSAAILVYENRWAAPLAVALRRGGAQLVASGRIPIQALLAALDATETGTTAGTPS